MTYRIYVLFVCTVSIHISTLGQWVFVPQGVCMLLFEINTFAQSVLQVPYTIRLASWINHSPGSHNRTGTDRCAQTNQIRVGFSTVIIRSNRIRIRGDDGTNCPEPTATTKLTVTGLAKGS